MYIYHPNTKMTHKNDRFIENLMKVPAPLKVDNSNSFFFAITQHCDNLNPMLEESNLYGANLKNYRSYVTDTQEIYTLTMTMTMTMTTVLLNINVAMNELL